MKNELKLTIVQHNIFWEDVEKNSEHLNTLIQKINTKPDLIVFPEMFLTAYNVRPYHIPEQWLNYQKKWLVQTSKVTKSALVGSFLQKDINNKFYNQFFLLDGEGNFQTYNKSHLFFPGGEHLAYNAGGLPNDLIFGEWKIRPSVCFDLRFPVMLRNNTRYHILICVANWPSARQEIFTTLLKARAIENQCYVIGVNRIGKDKKGITYIGGSCIIGPKGTVLSQLENKEGILEYTLNMQHLEDFRKEFPVLDHADCFELKADGKNHT